MSSFSLIKATMSFLFQKFSKKISKFVYKENHKLIETFREKHHGEVAFLIGNGPSVKIDDLEKMRGNLTFCCNRFHLAYDKTSFRPTYTVSSDRQMVKDFGNEIVENSHGTVFLVLNRNPNYIIGDYVWIRLRSRSPLVFSTNIHDHAMPGGGTLITAIQIAFFMGVKRFILYGVDHNFSYSVDHTCTDSFKKAYGDGNHFIENYRQGKNWCPPAVSQIEESFQICDQFLRARNGWIINATHGGKLEVLERADFDSMIKHYGN